MTVAVVAGWCGARGNDCHVFSPQSVEESTFDRLILGTAHQAYCEGHSSAKHNPSDKKCTYDLLL